MEDNEERRKNQKEFRAILEKYGLTQDQAAALITNQSFRQIQGRTVRTWLANPDAVSARHCPLWAVVTLQIAAAKQTQEDKKK